LAGDRFAFRPLSEMQNPLCDPSVFAVIRWT